MHLRFTKAKKQLQVPAPDLLKAGMCIENKGEIILFPVLSIYSCSIAASSGTGTV